MAIIGALSISTGAKSLKSVDGQNISQDDACIVIDNDGVYFYRLESNSGQSENIPFVVTPSVNAGNKRWILTSETKFKHNILLDENNYVQTPEIRELVDGEGIIFTLQDGTQICRIDQDGIILNRELIITSDNLNIDNINSVPVNTFVLSNGTVAFTNPVAGVNPSISYHLATKGYVDDEISGIAAPDLSNYIEYNNITAYNVIDDYNPAHKKYVDDTLSEGISGTYMKILDYDYDSSGVVDEAEQITGQGDLATLDVITDTYIDSETSPSGETLFSDGSGNTYWDSIKDSYIDSESTTNGYVLTADGSGSAEWRESSGGGGGGSGLPQIMPEDCGLDDEDTGSERGNAFGMIETINFSPSADGAAWFTMHFPSTLDDSSDINLDLIYNLNGSDDSKTVNFTTDYWVYGDTETPIPSASDGTNNDTISTGTGEDGQRQSTTLSVIPATSLTAGNTITLKFTREGSSDNYGGTFQLLYVFPYQS